MKLSKEVTCYVIGGMISLVFFIPPIVMLFAVLFGATFSEGQAFASMLLGFIGIFVAFFAWAIGDSMR